MKNELIYIFGENQKLFAEFIYELVGVDVLTSRRDLDMICENEKLKFEQIFLKWEHTIEVVKNATYIAESIKVVPEGMKKETFIALCQYIALLHDFGRIKQYELQGNFLENGKDLPRHVVYSIEVLFGKKEIIRRFIKTNEYDDLIKKAVLYHGVDLSEIPKDLSELEQLLIYIIRDADKMDIYRTCLIYSEEAVFTGENFQDCTILDELYCSLMNDKVMLYRLANHNEIHNLIGKLAFTLDLNTQIACETAKSYMPKLYKIATKKGLLPKTEQRMEDIYEMLYSKLEQRIIELKTN